MSTIKITAQIKKMSREAGKNDATLQVIVPASQLAQIPMGKVNMSIEQAQTSMFEKEIKKPVRGDKG